MNIKLIVRLFIITFCISHLQAGSKKEGNINVSFHMETEAGENPKMIFPSVAGGKSRYFRRIPDASMKDIAAFSPFLADDSVNFGIVFQLRESGKNRVMNVTIANQGRYLAAMVNGQVRDAVMIDKGITDGNLVIWNNVTEAEIKQLDKSLPRIGEVKGKKKKKEKVK
jgi:hypothetical protein